MELILLRSLSHSQSLIVVIIKCVKGVGIIHHNIKQGLILIVLLYLLVLDSTSYHLHQLAQIGNLLTTNLLVDGIAFYEIFLQDAVGPFTKLNTTITFHSITNRSNHFEIEILNIVSLGFTLYCAMLSGIRKFCDNHFIGQFFFKSIVDVLAYRLIVTTKQCCQLLASHPDHPIIQLHIKLDCIILVFVNYNTVIHIPQVP